MRKGSNRRIEKKPMKMNQMKKDETLPRKTITIQPDKSPYRLLVRVRLFGTLSSVKILPFILLNVNDIDW